MTSIDDILADFDVIDDWEERYRYVIELGKGLEPIAEADRNEETKVRGCASQVWLTARVARDADGVERLWFTGDSDAHIVKGLVAIMIAIFSGRTAREIIDLDAEAIFDRIGLREHITPQRANGVNAMMERIRLDARRVVAGVA